jgi:hypothetical protein
MFENHKQSMEQGNSVGQNNYDNTLVYEIGIAADPAAGAAILKRVADQGLSLVQYNYAFDL